MRASLGILACGLIGCASTDDPSLDAVEQAAKCPIWHCGSNSPEIAGHGFHELHELGAPNQEGFEIVDFTRNGVSYLVDVAGGKLHGLDETGTVVLSSAAGNLAGSQLLVQHAGGGMYLIRISAVATGVDFFAVLPTRGPQPSAEAYVLEWVLTFDGISPAPRRSWKNVCSLATPDDTNPEYLGMWGEHTLLFEGDRIDAEKKTVSDTPDETWFNLGCAGHALAKLHLTGHTRAATFEGFTTTWQERQTMLKMFVADYTGTGIPFTVAGIPLSWMDDQGTMEHPADVTLEARWTPDGASCLEEARIDVNSTLQSLIAFPDGAVAAMQAEGLAVPPPCAPVSSAYDLDGAHIVSANP